MVLIEKDDEGSEESVEDHRNYDCSVDGALDESQHQWPSSPQFSFD